MVRVTAVQPDSIADAVGIVPGTELLSVNGRTLEDFLDWEFLTADEAFVVSAKLPDGELVEFDIERDAGDVMGITLAPPTIRRCANRCEFCFIEGLPKGLRKPLYVRDDDYRLSFAYGNFATLSEREGAGTSRASSSTDCRRSTCRCTPRPGKPGRCCSTTRACPTSSSSSRGWPMAASSSTGRWSSSPGSTMAPCSRSRSRTCGIFGDAMMSVAIVPVGLTQFSHLYTGQSMDAANALARCSTTWTAGPRGRWPSAAIAGCSAPTSCICWQGASCRSRHYGEFSADRERRRGGGLAAPARGARGSISCRASTAAASAW
jgi:hypothetical protein